MLELGLILLAILGGISIAIGLVSFLEIYDEGGFSLAAIAIGILLICIAIGSLETLSDQRKALATSQATAISIAGKYREMSVEHEKLLQVTEGYQENLDEVQGKLYRAYARNEAMKTVIVQQKAAITTAKVEYSKAMTDMVGQFKTLNSQVNAVNTELTMCEHTKEAYSKSNEQLNGIIFEATEILRGSK